MIWLHFKTQSARTINQTLLKSIVRKTCVKGRMIAGKQFKGATHRWVGLHKPPVVTHSPLVALDTFTHYCVYIIPQKTDCNIRLIYVCLQARTPQITLHRFPASCLNVSLFAHVHYLSHLHSCGVCIFSLFIGNHLYIYIYIYI